MTGKKKQHNVWARQLTKLLSLITFCELCGTRPMELDIAHRLKRRLIGWRTEDDRLEYMCAVKLCRRCHVSLDEAKTSNAHQIMFETITRIILRRDSKLLWNEDVITLPFIVWDPVKIYTYVRG